MRALRQSLQLLFYNIVPTAVAAPAIAQYQYPFCRWVQRFYRTVPMVLYVVADKLCRILCFSNGQVAFVVLHVIYAVGDHRALGETVEIMVITFCALVRTACRPGKNCSTSPSSCCPCSERAVPPF